MIQSIKVTNYRGESKTFVLPYPEESGYAIKEVQGLGPPRASINLGDRAQGDGSVFNSARIGNRNIVLYLIFFADDVEHVRHDSYRLFPLKKEVTIQVTTDERVCETTGYVESNEPVIFSSQEMTQVSILCPDPYFYAVGDAGKRIIPCDLPNQFEFPFENKSLTEPTIEFLMRENGAQIEIDNQGDVEIGFTIRIKFKGPATGIQIRRANTQQRMRLDDNIINAIVGGIQIGDEIVINTRRGSKSIELIRGGTTYNIINALKSGATWHQLEVGVNLFKIYATDGDELNNLSISFEYRLTYQGV